MITIKNEQILKEKFVELNYDAENRVVEAKWIGFLKLEDVKKACEVMIQYVAKNAIIKHLSNQTELKVLSKEVQEYLINECFPELEKKGLRRVAVLVSDDVFAQATVSNVNMKSKVGKLSFNTVNHRNNAINWLNEK